MKIIPFFLIFFLPIFVFPRDFQTNGIVNKVVDGDTIYIMALTNQLKIRLADIDCPEKDQPYGVEAKLFVANLVLGKEIIVKYKKKDRYKRIIGTVILTNGIYLNNELLKNGLAHWYYQYSTNKEMQQLEIQARINKIGLWQDPNNIPPWDWRKRNKRKLPFFIKWIFP